MCVSSSLSLFCISAQVLALHTSYLNHSRDRSRQNTTPPSTYPETPFSNFKSSKSSIHPPSLQHTNHRPWGNGGSGLLESDDQLDAVKVLETYTSNIELYAPRDPEATSLALNNGKLCEILGRLRSTYPPSDYKYVLLGACLMHLGANLPSELKDYIREIYKDVDLWQGGHEQMEKALREYRNDGTPFEFGGLDSVDTTTAETEAGR